MSISYRGGSGCHDGEDAFPTARVVGSAVVFLFGDFTGETLDGRCGFADTADLPPLVERE